MSMKKVILLTSLMVWPTMQVFAETTDNPKAAPDVFDMPPPPPPGPYMSMALMEAPGFSRSKEMPAVEPAAEARRPAFRPDMPWPEARRAPQRWMPDDGYTFAPQQLPPPVMQPRFGQPRPSPSSVWGDLSAPPGQLYARPQRPEMQRPEMQRPQMQRPEMQRPARPERPSQARPAPPERPAAPRDPWLPLGNYGRW